MERGFDKLINVINVRGSPSPWATRDKRPPYKEFPPHHVIICGTRDFEDYDLLKRKMDLFTYWMDTVVVHTGGDIPYKIGYQRYGGADYLGVKWAEQNWWDRCIHPAEWDKLGKKAGPIRNVEMAKAVAPNGYCVAFWNGESSGTEMMIDTFCRYNKESRLRVIQYLE